MSPLMPREHGLLQSVPRVSVYNAPSDFPIPDSIPGSLEVRWRSKPV